MSLSKSIGADFFCLQKSTRGGDGAKMRQMVYPWSVWISRGMRRARGGIPNRKAIRLSNPAWRFGHLPYRPGLGRTPKASVNSLTVGVKELTVYLKGDSVNNLTVRQNIDGQCQDIDGGRKANGRRKAKRRRTYVRTKIQRNSEGQAKVSIGWLVRRSNAGG